jgi:hypothetical protein
MDDRAALAPAVVAGLLGSAVVALGAEIEALPEAVTAFHPAPGEWCVKAVVGHLIEAERRGFAGRVRTILTARTPDLLPWDQNEVARSRRDCARDVRGLLDELTVMRRESATLVAGLGAADLARAGQHPEVGVLTIAELLQEWVHHDRTHLTQILANVQAYVWPAMGNAQRFSRRTDP